MEASALVYELLVPSAQELLHLHDALHAVFKWYMLHDLVLVIHIMLLPLLVVTEEF